MRSFRSKPTGWQRDSYRHYLAAKYGSAGGKKYLAGKHFEQVDGRVRGTFYDPIGHVDNEAFVLGKISEKVSRGPDSRYGKQIESAKKASPESFKAGLRKVSNEENMNKVTAEDLLSGKKKYMAKEVKYYEPDEEPGKYGKVSFVESVIGKPVPQPKIALFEPKLPKTKEGVQREIAKTSDIMAADIASGKRPNVQDEIREFELERKREGLKSGDEREFYRLEKLARLERMK